MTTLYLLLYAPCDNRSLNSKGAHEVGGLGEVWNIAKDQGRLDVWK